MHDETHASYFNILFKKISAAHAKSRITCGESGSSLLN